MTLHLALLCALLLCCLASAILQNLLYAGMALALASISLTLLLFEMSAPWAAVFELSVCAGLITVLFISAISLVGRHEYFHKEDRLRFYALPVFLAMFGLAFWLFSEPLAKALVPALPGTTQLSVGDLLWNFRWFDVVGQICIFLAGVLMIRTFFARSRKDV
ncbi:MAG TPA: hypothetical protein PLL10_06595 [Elusimicrobiales bacterium]|nr:hypothetical protein [Elusimicrobiales bacterium]